MTARCWGREGLVTDSQSIFWQIIIWLDFIIIIRMILTISAVILGSLSPTIGSYYLDVNMCSILYCCISIHTIVLLFSVPAFILLLPHIPLSSSLKNSNLQLLNVFLCFLSNGVNFKIECFSVIWIEMVLQLRPQNYFWNWIVIYYLIIFLSKYSFQTVLNTIIQKIFPLKCNFK